MKTLTKAILASLILILAFVLAEIAKSPSVNSNSVQIFFFDVGQGDSALIQKGDFQILIDGGPDDKILAELGRAMPLTDKKIEMMILSHPHADHITGFNNVLDRYQVGQIYSGGVVSTSSQYLNFLNKIKEKNIKYSVPNTEDLVDLFTGGKLEFLWPGIKYKETTIDNLNNSSEVMRFCYLSACALFTGDIELEEQNLMLDYYSKLLQTDKLKSEVLKIPHHGSSNGANMNLYNAVSPKYAVISVGVNNQYGHPHVMTLDLLKRAGIQIFRTDQDGTVKLQFSQNGIEKE